MFDADDLAFLLWFCVAGLLAVGLAWLAENYAGREMRKRQRERAALERYVGLIWPRDQP